MAEIVGHDDVVARDIQRLTGPEQFARELRRQELGTRPAGAVQQQDRVLDPPVRAPPRLAQGAVVHPQLRQHPAGSQRKGGGGEVALDRHGLGRSRQGQQQGGKAAGEGQEAFHQLGAPVSSESRAVQPS